MWFGKYLTFLKDSSCFGVNISLRQGFGMMICEISDCLCLLHIANLNCDRLGNWYYMWVFGCIREWSAFWKSVAVLYIFIKEICWNFQINFCHENTAALHFRLPRFQRWPANICLLYFRTLHGPVLHPFGVLPRLHDGDEHGDPEYSRNALQRIFSYRYPASGVFFIRDLPHL